MYASYWENILYARKQTIITYQCNGVQSLNLTYFVCHEFVHLSMCSLNWYLLSCPIRKANLVRKDCSWIPSSPQQKNQKLINPLTHKTPNEQVNAIIPRVYWLECYLAYYRARNLLHNYFKKLPIHSIVVYYKNPAVPKTTVFQNMATN